MNKEYFDIEYGKKGRSFRDISKELKIPISRTIKLALSFGHLPRTKSEAQRLALKTGAAVHPTQGKHLDEEHKKKIAIGISESYNNMTDQEKAEYAKKRAEIWNNRDENKTREMQEKAVKAARLTSKTGSKLEKIVLDKLQELGYHCQFHKKDMLANVKLEMDIFIPALNLCIEIDGPSHVLPIWSEDSLRRTQQADAEKNGLLLSNGINILRIRQVVKRYTMSKVRTDELLKNIENKVNEIKFGSAGPKIYYLDVGDK